MKNSNSYIPYLKLIETFTQVGFDALKPDEPVMVEFEEFTKSNDQFFYFGGIVDSG